MLLANKTAVIYGAGGTIGGAVAEAFAAEGARLFLAGRTGAKVDEVAARIARDGGTASAAEVDALDENAVERHAAAIAAEAGRIDIMFNAIGMHDVQGPGLLELTVEDTYRPVHNGFRSNLITARATARHMLEHRSGVLLTITAGPAREATPGVGGFGPACDTIEALWRNLAAELGAHGVRTIGIRSAGSPDSPDLQAMFAEHAAAEGVPLADYLEGVGAHTLLNRLPLVAEVAAAVTLMASERASALTGTFIDVTCGSPTS
ncbi:MAG TPA: SDR family oxidoreductase [Mycobacteriales bacterium]|jgi:NAD(P)-dependent dehydrogenase (short-subunit alcohol dehydrogenase family)|nr:SDR family oxidoreductase [Mycobacteriales bacterium]